jgi:ribonuclease P protein component
VTRNLVKRRLRAIVRTVLLDPGFDIAVSARPAAAVAGFGALEAAVTGLLSRARLLRPQ